MEKFMEKLDRYYDIVSEIVVMRKLDKIPDAAILANELSRHLFDDIRPYMKSVDLTKLDELSKDDLYNELRYIDYKDNGCVRNCVLTDINNISIEDDLGSFYIKEFSGYDVESGSLVKTDEFHILNNRNLFEDNFPLIVNTFIDLGVRTNNEELMESVIKTMGKKMPAPTFKIHQLNTKSR